MKVLTVVGARPQFIKLGPVSRALRSRADERIVHTGQHYDAAMSGLFFQELALPKPDYNLDVGSASHGVQTARILERLEPIMMDEQPDWVLVYGDTNSTLAAALCAAKLHLPIAHVEAGVRSYNRRMPEEINRVLCDAVSSLLFCPTEQAVLNLSAEGVTRGVHCVGDVMFDAVRFNVALANPRQGELLRKLEVSSGQYGVATVHRAESTDDPRTLNELISALEGLAEELPIVFPAHPRTRKCLAAAGRELGPSSKLKVIEPLGYLEMLALIDSAKLVVTDSGGLQKEAWFMRTPCITLRTETEWVETLVGGANRLVSPGVDVGKRLSKAATEATCLPESAWSGTPFGDGDASKRIADELLGEGSR